MVNLSERAWRMLNEKPRDLNEQPQTVQEIELILQAEGCPTDHAIIPFQLQLAGYCYRKYSEEIRLGMTTEPQIEHFNGQWLCEFATTVELGAPDALVMDEIGAVYWYRNPTPFASSIRVYLESNALYWELRNSTRSRVETGKDGSIKMKTEELSILDLRLKEFGFLEQREVSDKYERWWFGPTGWVHAFTVSNQKEATSAVALSIDTVPDLEKLLNILDGLVVFSSLPKYYFLPSLPNKI